MKKASWVVVIVFFRFLFAWGDDLGKIAPVFPVQEYDAAVQLENLAATKQSQTLLHQQMNRFIIKLQRYIEHPSLMVLPEVAHIHRHWVDMSIRLNGDVFDNEGRLLYRQGSVINPLAFVHYGRILCFLDGSSSRQWRWAQKNCPDESVGHIIFVHPPWLIYARQKRVYFDQYGVLVQRFHIKSLPALVRQTAVYMEVQEGYEE